MFYVIDVVVDVLDEFEDIVRIYYFFDKIKVIKIIWVIKVNKKKF